MQSLSDLKQPFKIDTTTIKYDFSLGLWNGDYNLSTGIEHEFNVKSALSPTLKSYFAAAAEAWDDVTVFDISEAGVSDTPNVHVYDANLGSVSGNAGLVGYFANTTQTTAEGPPDNSTYLRAEVAFDSSSAYFISFGSAFWLMMHEFGHALGLKDVTNPTQYNTDMTVMSYNIASGGTRYAVTPMAYDIAALEQMYGSNSVRTGSDTYGNTWFTGTNRSLTIHDTGTGIDTFDLSGRSGNHRINLNQAIDGSDQWAVTDGVADGAATIVNGLEYVYISRGTRIENAVGGTGDDTIIGNNLANEMSGGNGSDVLRGGAGYDTYIMRHGETGTDQIIDSDGSGEIRVNGRALTGDAIYNTHQNPGTWAMGHYTLSLTGTSGADLTFTPGFAGDSAFVVKNFTNGDLGINLVTPNQVAANPASPSGGAGDVVSYAMPGPTSYSGTNGDDQVLMMYDATLSGGGGNDALSAGGLSYVDGGVGDDILSGGYAYGGDGNDVIFAGIYADGGAGDDSIQGAATTIIGGSGNDTIEGVAAGANISGGNGNDLIYSRNSQTVSGGVDSDTIHAYDGGASIEGDDGDDLILIVGGNGYYLSGGDGNDTIGTGNSSWNSNTVVGGAGFDTYYSYGNIDISGEAEGSRVYTDQASTVTGGDGDDIFFGSASGDILVGQNGADYLSGHAGADTIYGGASNDTISGGNDGDSLTGDAGNDIIYGDAGDDVIDAGVGINIIHGGSGNDSLTYASAGSAMTINLATGTATNGSTINDTFTGIETVYGSGYADNITGSSSGDAIYLTGGNDTIDAADGNDYITVVIPTAHYTVLGGNGTDTINFSAIGAVSLNLAGGWASYSGGSMAIAGIEHVIGSTYSDTLWGGLGADIIAGDAGNDSLVGEDGADTLSGGDGLDSIYGGLLADSIDGGAGNDYIEGGDGNDLIVGGAGSDYIDGGAGIDTVSYAASSAWVNVDLANNNHWNGDAAWDNISNVENVIGSAYGDALIGTTGVNVLTGGDGNDTLTGLAGNDTLNGDDGDDSISGGDNNDMLAGGAGNDSIDGGDGNDVIQGGAGADSLIGGNGSDQLIYALSGSAVSVNLATGMVSGGDAAGDTIAGFEHVTGGAFNDTIIGNSAGNFLTGNDGNDSMDGGLGNDTLNGGAGNNVLNGGDGNDMLFASSGADTLNGGLNTDTIAYSASSAGVSINLATGAAAGGDAAGDVFSSIENVTGSGHADSLTGNSDANTLLGSGGDDTIDGGDGNDTIDGSLGADSLIGGNGVDTLFYSGSAAISINLATGAASGGFATGDTISGFENVQGTNFADTLIGSSGDNYLDGGFGGDDWLDGGLGNDQLLGGNGNDTFYFNGSHGNDTIVGFDGVGAAAGDLIHIAGGTFGVLSFTQSGAHTIINTGSGFITVNGANAASFTIDDFNFA